MIVIVVMITGMILRVTTITSDSTDDNNISILVIVLMIIRVTTVTNINISDDNSNSCVPQAPGRGRLSGGRLSGRPTPIMNLITMISIIRIISIISTMSITSETINSSMIDSKYLYC